MNHNIQNCYAMNMVGSILQNIGPVENLTGVSKTIQKVFCANEEKLCSTCEKYDKFEQYPTAGFEKCPGFTVLVNKVLPTLHMKKEDIPCEQESS